MKKFLKKYLFCFKNAVSRRDFWIVSVLMALLLIILGNIQGAIAIFIFVFFGLPLLAIFQHNISKMQKQTHPKAK